ncbi:winged helix-turn-helix transcriptional regulator [Pseudocolwellia agarivorans]|uniref:winged helix-turn-helix transcriptional regulator n=1 Tax=Pseudocolwellia agarivorans TaxID=1911682 RepID=UPI0009872F57|nr:helix-turn-helix domain-containing protein [Pseudocolwellia agarivorans]
MSFPLPGEPVRGSKTGKPIMALFDLLGRTWALGIIWNLQKSSCTFRELQQRCENISPTLLNKRISELKETSIVEKSLHGYCLTHLGNELFNLIEPLGSWSVNWNHSLKEGMDE